MEQIEHTRGPWVVFEGNKGVLEIRPAWPTHGATVGFTPIAKVTRDKRTVSEEVRDANALVIAKAPELLALVKRTVAILQLSHIDAVEGSDNPLEKLLFDASAVISKPIAYM